MKYFALFSIALYFAAVYFLKEEPQVTKQNLEQDVVIKKMPTPEVVSKAKPQKKTVDKPKESKPVVIKKELAKKVLANFPKTLKTTITPIKEMIYLKHGLQIPALKVLISLKNKRVKNLVTTLS